MAVTTDEDLAARVKAGDDAAFATIFERYHRRLELYCRSLLRNDEDARDAVQNAMANALVALRRHDRELHVRPWLFRIAHNEAITLLRRRRDDVELGEGLLSAPGDPLDDLLLRERLELTLDGVRELPVQHRRALMLREMAGLSHEQVGRELGMSASGAKHAIFRARSTLLLERRARDQDCASVRAVLADHDGRRRRGRAVRGHLRGCGPCRAWDEARHRSRRRVAFVPPFFVSAAGSAWTWVSGLLGGSGGEAVIGAGGGVAATTKAVATVAAIAAATGPVAGNVVHRPARERTAGPVLASAAAV